MKSESLYLFLRKDLSAIEAEIKATLEGKALDSSKAIIRYILESKGKLIRPILVLLSAYSHQTKINKVFREHIIKISAAIELIHMASLLHDDIIDEASERRGRASVNAKYGDAVSVTMGVMLYAAALELISETDNSLLLKELSQTVRHMCEGEVLQYSNRKAFNYSESDYFKVIYAKTATLFKTACLSGGLISDASQEDLAALEKFGESLGIAFQLSDDYLDLFGDKESLNKELGQDYLQGQLTLPMIYALESYSDEMQKEIKEQIKNKDIAGFETLKESISSSEIKERLYLEINKHLETAKHQVRLIGDNKYCKGLTFLADYIFERVSSKNKSKILTKQ